MTRSVLRIGGGLSLLLFPLLFMLVFALHVESPADWLQLKWQHDPYVAADIMEGLRDTERTRRYYVLPHMVGYLSMPVLIAAALTLGWILFLTRPGWAIAGATMSCVGAVFMAGMLAMWLAFVPVGNVPAEYVPGAAAALEAMMAMQGPLLLSTILTGLSLIGIMVLAVGFYLSGVVPRWSPVLILIGCLMMSVFIDLDNLMFSGALLTFCGMAPISRMLFKNEIGTVPNR